MTSSFTLNRDFLLGAHVRILLLHGGHAGVQQCTVIDEKKSTFIVTMEQYIKLCPRLSHLKTCCYLC